MSDYCAVCSDLQPGENEYAICSFSKCELRFDCSGVAESTLMVQMGQSRRHT